MRVDHVTLVLFLAVADAWAQDKPCYARDDGDADKCFVGSCFIDICVMHGYDAVGGEDTIVRVDYAFGCPHFPGTEVPDGTPVKIYVWDDPNDDGDPIDAVLVSESADVAMFGNTNTFVQYSVPPARVTGHFFVGVAITNECWAFGSGDLSYQCTGDAWATCNTTPGAFNPYDLASNDCGPFEMCDFGLPQQWLLRAVGTSGATTFCTAKVNSCGTVPEIASSGEAQVSQAHGFLVSVTSTRAARPGLLCYTDSGPASVPFEGGLLCVNAPIRRTVPVFETAGTPGSCDGMLTIDMNTFAQGSLGGNPAAFLGLPGATVHCQWWARDTNEHGSLLSDGLRYVICQ